MLEALPVVVVDLETAQSAEDCRSCGHPKEAHFSGRFVAGKRQGLQCFAGSTGPGFVAIGWENKVALGLSIGCYYDSRDSRLHWFDIHTLEETMWYFVEAQPLLVSFNGIHFDFPLMRGLLRRAADAMHDIDPDAALVVEGLCNTFKVLCASSYDLLAEIWRVDPARKFERGLNSLDALSQANGLGAKAMTGAQAPRLWRQGRYAEVIGYCQGDVEKARALFEMVCAGQPILLGDGQPIMLRNPWHKAGALLKKTLTDKGL